MGNVLKEKVCPLLDIDALAATYKLLKKNKVDEDTTAWLLSNEATDMVVYRSNGDAFLTGFVKANPDSIVSIVKELPAAH